MPLNILLAFPIRKRREYSFIPIGIDEFKLQGIDAKLTFERGVDRVIESLTLHQNGEHMAKKIE